MHGYARLCKAWVQQQAADHHTPHLVEPYLEWATSVFYLLLSATSLITLAVCHLTDHPSTICAAWQRSAVCAWLYAHVGQAVNSWHGAG